MHYPSTPESLLDNLPPIIANAVAEVSENVQVPLEIAVSSALAAASYACQFKADVARQSHLVSPTSLNFITIAQSSDRKTGCDTHFTKPIREFEASLQTDHENNLRRFESDIDIWQIKRKTLLSRIQKLTKAGKDTGEDELSLRSLDMLKPREPLEQKFIFGDITPEAMASRLEAWPSIAIFSNDAGAVFGSSSLQNLGLLNQIWDGSPPRIERISRRTRPIPIARLTISLMVQSQTLKDFLEKRGSLARDNGFLSRVLITQPQSIKGRRFEGFAEPAWRHLPKYQDRLSHILKAGYEEQKQSDYRPGLLKLDRPAMTRWKDFTNEIERGIQPEGFWSDISDAASKAPEQAVRLAGLFHMIEQGEGDIASSTLENAVNVIRNYLYQFKTIFGGNMLSLEQQDADNLKKFLVKKFNSRGAEPLRRSWIMQNVVPIALRSKERLLPALEILYDQRLFREVHHGGSLCVLKTFDLI